MAFLPFRLQGGGSAGIETASSLSRFNRERGEVV